MLGPRAWHLARAVADSAGPVTRQQLRDKLPWHRQTIAKHLRRLVELGMVDKTEDGYVWGSRIPSEVAAELGVGRDELSVAQAERHKAERERFRGVTATLKPAWQGRGRQIA